MQFAMFSKHLDMLGLSVADVAQDMKSIGLDGVDLTVRPGGRVEPENVEKQLPEVCAQFAQYGLEVSLLTTAIDSIHSPYAEAIFDTAAECGIPAIKLGYWYLRNPKEFWSVYDYARVQLAGIAELAGNYGVSANIHIHSGPFLSAMAPVVYMLLDEVCNPSSIGAYIDTGHMLIEGGYDGWRQGMIMLAPYTNLVALKGYSWAAVEEDGKTKVTRKMLGFSESMQDWKQIFTLLKDFGYDGTVSLHSEYGELDRAGLVKQTKSDLQVIKDTLAEIAAEK